eukprot:jgi/Chlat1/4788/Chrsp31S04826
MSGEEAVAAPAAAASPSVFPLSPPTTRPRRRQTRWKGLWLALQRRRGVAPPVARRKGSLATYRSFSGMQEQIAVPRSMLHPENHYYLMWLNFTIALTLYSAIMAPFQISFYRQQLSITNWSVITDFCVNFVFLIDIVVEFNTAFYRDGVLVVDRKQIAFKYMTGRFVFDVIASFPWDVFIVVLGSDHWKYFALSRLVRLHRLMPFFERLENNVELDYFWIRVARFALIVLLAAHWSACIQYWIATVISDVQSSYLTLNDPELPNAALISEYITTLYYVFVTISTVGFGDIHAVGNADKLFTTIEIILNMGLVAYLIGNMTVLVTRKDTLTLDYRQKAYFLDMFMRRNNVPIDLRQDMEKHLQLQFERRFDKQDLLQDVPSHVRTRLSRFLYLKLLRGCWLFRGCTEGFIDYLVCHAKTEFFLPNSYILFENIDAGNELYMMLSGCVDLFTSPDSASDALTHVTELKRGDVFGDVALLCNTAQPFTKAYRRALRLSSEQQHILMVNLYQRLKAWHSPVFEPLVAQVEEQLTEADRAAFDDHLETNNKKQELMRKVRERLSFALPEWIRNNQGAGESHSADEAHEAHSSDSDSDRDRDPEGSVRSAQSVPALLRATSNNSLRSVETNRHRRSRSLLVRTLPSIIFSSGSSVDERWANRDGA